METKKINFSGLEKVLSPKEMKNITGGSNNCSADCTGTCTVGQYNGRCGWTNGVGCTCAYAY